MVQRTPAARESLVGFLAPTKKAEQEIIFELERAGADLEDKIKRLTRSSKISDRVRADQYRAARRAIHVRLAETYQNVGLITLKHRSQAIVRATEIGGAYDAVVMRRGMTAKQIKEHREGLLRNAEEQVERLMLRHQYTHMPLSRQVYRTQALTNGWVDRLIARNIAQGASVKEFADELSRFINPNVRGGVRYAATRLARTEISNAYHAAAVRHAQISPYVTGLKWNLSSSHGRPDACDALNEKVFDPFKVPRKPHPQCMCFLTPVSPSEEDFINAFLATL